MIQCGIGYGKAAFGLSYYSEDFLKITGIDYITANYLSSLELFETY